MGQLVDRATNVILIPIIDDTQHKPDIRRDNENGERWLIAINEFAEIDISNAWNGQRNPVFYTSLQELGIDATKLTFQPIPQTSTTSSSQMKDQAKHADLKLTIADAKKALAVMYGCEPENIEITIRG